jgi:hypothetical protein
MEHTLYGEQVNGLFHTQTLCVGSAQLWRGGKRAANSWLVELKAVTHKDGLKGEFVHLSTTINASNARVLITMLNQLFQTRICECFNFCVYSFKLSINKHDVQYSRTRL